MTAYRRSVTLLTEAARVLDDGGIPLMDPFLSEHEVTLDEAYSLAEKLALGARIVAAGLADPRSPEGHAMLLTMARNA
jgi:hypothetical protein